ncbi:HNH endonuclease [Pseudenhygromyxa sp. WMMC2535]|uniref:RHS repeat-associated core domain-containing protein n=1 Tax=Pseudenhygromyxa sp. WMMC2535 TaxID=2712867 RepID=UPI001595EB26|nr:HNH endonuclease [Pseudenhygromyxa sp. WMMC2535]
MRAAKPSRAGQNSLLALLGLVVLLVLPPRADATSLAGSFVQRLILAGPLAESASQLTASAPVGTLPGTFVVDDRGAARYSVPLALPPAARGFAPVLSLEYDSQRGDGGLGVGWALSGASAIDRCPRTLADDGYFRGVHLDDEDALCLDGQRLRLVEGEHLQPGARYRPKRDDLSSVRAIAHAEDSKQSCAGGLGFEVRRSDGTIDLYGCRRDAVALHPRGLASWSLAERRDRFGNVYALNYTNETELLEDGEADVERWLTSLEYGGHTTLHAFTRHVRLEWEDRPDPAAGWRLGAPQRQTKRLAALSTFAEGELVHRYALDYDTPSITGRSLLHAVRQCDAQGVCRPDTTFAWTAGELDFDAVPEQTNFAIELAWPYLASIWSDTPNTLAPRVLAQTILDANGDGRSDFLLAVGQSNTPAPEGRGWELWTSQPKADTAVAPCSTRDDDLAQCLGLGHYLVHEDPISGLLAGPSYDDLAPATPPLFAADIDGDGRDDAVGLGDSIHYFGGAPPAGNAFYLALARPEGGVEQVEFDPGVSPIWQFTAHDQTGDGLGDLLFCAGDPLPNALDEPELGTGTWHFTPNLPGETFSPEQVVDTGEPCSVYDKLLVLDHDGDGLASLLVIPTWDAQLGAWIPSSKWSNYHALRLSPGDWSLSLEDTGLPPDLAQRWRPSLTAHYNDAYLDEDFPRSMQGFGLDKILDIDGDGLSDILRYELVSGDTAEDLGVLMQTIVVTDPPWAEQGGIRLWRNTGAGFVDGGWLLLSPEPGKGGFRRFLAAGVLDYDADGRLDLLSPVSDPNDDTWNWSIFNLDSEGVLHEHPEVFHSPVQEFASNVHSVGAFDLDGDGLHDPGVFLGSSWQLRTHAGEVPDKLKTITNGLGARIEVDYRASADIDAPEGYADAELDSPNCLYPARCDRSPRLLVEAHRVDSGISDAPQTFTHRYGTARRDREAQRSLGFRFHETTEWRDALPVYRRLVRFDPSYDDDLHAFPFAGMPSLVAEDHRDPETGRHVVRVTSHSLKVHSTGPGSYLPYAAQTLASRYELDACEEDFCALTELDEDHRITREVHTVFDLDDFGNPTHWTRTTSTGSETFTYRTQTSFQNDAQTWLLALPTKTVLSFEQPGIPVRTRESIAAYDPETGALLHHETQPNDAELRLVTGYAYDAHGNEVTRAAIDGNGIVRTDTTKFDDHGVFPISTTNALGHQTKLRWHPGLGVLTETRDPNNLRLVADYDGLGHVTALRHFAGDDPRGDDITFSYAALQDQDPDAPVLELRQTTKGHGHRSLALDRLGRIVHERALFADGLERVTHSRYDQAGHHIAQSLPTLVGTLPDGYERYFYDHDDRLVRHLLPDLSEERWDYAGHEVLHHDLGGTASRLRYDGALRLVESVRALGSPDEERLCFDYSSFEQLTQVRPNCIEPHKGFDLPAGEAPPTIKSFAYDDLGRLTHSHDPSEGPRSYAYNGHGELAAILDANDQLTTFTHDGLGRLITRDDPDGQTTWTWDTTFIGALAHTQSPSGHEDLYDYDPHGRLSALTKVIAGEPFTLRFAYDQHDRLTEIHYPENELSEPFWIRNLHAQSGDLVEVRRGSDDAPLWTLESLTQAGQISTERLGNGAQTTRSYDPLRGFVEQIQTHSLLGGDLQDLRYDWNPDGTLLRRQDLLGAQSEVFSYDDLHRPIQTTTTKAGSEHVRHFAYDALGNLAFASDRGAYDYDANGRLTYADGRTHTWDPKGNLLAREAPGETLKITYTAFDAPAQLLENNLLTELEYDADQTRVYRYAEAQDGPRETIYVTDLYQRQRTPETTEHHYYIPGPERLIADVVDTHSDLEATRTTHYIHVDHLGSTDALSSKAGVLEHRQSYDLWGKARDPEDWTLPEEFAALSPINRGYTGHEAQSDSGLLHMRGRMYDPHLGRMASADPFVVDPLSSSGWNRYAYVLNQPLARTDPSGFMPTAASTDPESSSDSEPQDFGFEMTVPVVGTRTAEGVAGSGQVQQSDIGGGGSASARADQQAGDIGPSAAQIQQLHDSARARGAGIVRQLNAPPLQGFTDAMVRPENPSQERRRLEVSQEAGARVIATMQDPPTHVVVSVELAMFFLSGDVEMVGGALRWGIQRAGQRKAVRELAEDGGEILIAGSVKRKKPKPKPGQTGGPGAGKRFSEGTKDMAEAQARGRCVFCGRKTQRVRGGTQRNTDHAVPKSRGGNNTLDNAQNTCRDCNLQKRTMTTEEYLKKVSE